MNKLYTFLKILVPRNSHTRLFSTSNKFLAPNRGGGDRPPIRDHLSLPINSSNSNNSNEENIQGNNSNQTENTNNSNQTDNTNNSSPSPSSSQFSYDSHIQDPSKITE